MNVFVFISHLRLLAARRIVLLKNRTFRISAWSSMKCLKLMKTGIMAVVMQEFVLVFSVLALKYHSTLLTIVHRLLTLVGT